LGLITNGPADIQRQEVNTLGIAHYFDHIWIEGEMGEGKPVTRVFERAVEAAGSTPETTLMVGNSYKHDVAAAINMGWSAIWIRRPSDVPPSAGPEAKPEERPQDGPVPTRTISDLRELYDFLGMSK
jgi:putative hydrolase of the HAD superfamily